MNVRRVSLGSIGLSKGKQERRRKFNPHRRSLTFPHTRAVYHRDRKWRRKGSQTIFATLCEAAALEPSAGIDGVSFLPTLIGRPQPGGDRDLYFLLREGGPLFGGKTIECLIRGPWMLIQDRPFGAQELYHLGRDPQETVDLASKETAVFGELGAALRRHIQRGGQVPWQ
ncbi:MAG: hypothetical protein HUU20_10315 [Pirellulales bacterium]|nr:hypothetical protein [Pirellulales bacterium]